MAGETLVPLGGNMLEVVPFAGDRLPQFEDRVRMWAELDIDARTPVAEDVARYCSYLRTTYSNGEVRFQTFYVSPHPVFDWYASRNQLHEMGFFGKIWSVRPVEAMMPERPFDLNFYATNVFSGSTPFVLGGTLASVLAFGGAYGRHELGSLHAKQTGEAAAAALICDRFDDMLVYGAHTAWSPFFNDVAWDYSSVVVDKRERLLHILCATDTD